MSILLNVPKAVVCLTVSMVCVAVPAFGQEAAPSGPLVVQNEIAAVDTQKSVFHEASDNRPKRPAALVPLEMSFAALQAFDVHSTLGALDRGGREANPLVGGLVERPAVLIALKGTTAASVIYVTEKLWKRHRTVAVLAMIGLNCGYGMVAWHNYSVGR
jgi:hypothetical protein